MSAAQTLPGASSDVLPVPHSANAETLAEAFRVFTRASDFLQLGYARLQSEVSSLRQEVETANRMSTILAHEMRNPLGSLELFAGSLADASLPPEQKSCVTQIQAGIRTLAATVGNVLFYYGRSERASSGVTSVIELGKLTRWLAGYLAPLAEQAGVAIRCVGHEPLISVVGDRHGLEQVLLNLGLNALRAMKNGGVLTLSDGPGSADEVWIEVKDTGVGIAPENLEKIFHASFSTADRGPGLGLAICKAILDQHGGRMRVTSELGEGASFRINLPQRSRQS